MTAGRFHGWRIIHERNQSTPIMQKPMYPALFEQTTKGFDVSFPDFPEVSAEGATFADAAANAAEALTQAIEALLASDEHVPESSKVKGAHHLAPSARVQSAVLFRRHLGSTRKSEVARTLETSLSRVRDLETAARNVSIDRADAAARALGYQLVLSYELIK